MFEGIEVSYVVFGFVLGFFCVWEVVLGMFLIFVFWI